MFLVYFLIKNFKLDNYYSFYSYCYYNIFKEAFRWTKSHEYSFFMSSLEENYYI